MTGEMPSFKDIFDTVRDSGLYTAHKGIEMFIKTYTGTDTITEGTYQRPEYEENPVEQEGYLGVWRPSELNLFNRTPEDDRRSKVLRERRMKEESDFDIPLTDEDRQRMVNNINVNNADLGLAPMREMLPPTGKRSVQLGTSVRGDAKANSVANRFIEGR